MESTKNYSAESFKRIEVDNSLKEKINRPSLTFWQDARVRLSQNKGALFAMVLLALILLMSIFGPYFNEYKFDQQIQPLRNHAKLPARIPVLENFGIFDGTLVKVVGDRGFEKLNDGEYVLLEEYDELDEGSGVYYHKYKIQELTYVKNDVADEYFWFGTDDLARDLWTRIWMGTRVSLYVGLLAAAFDMLIGVIYGAIAGFYGGRTDMIMMRITEVIGGIPYLVVMIMFILIFGSGIIPMSLAIALTGWMSMARVVRSQFLKLKDQEFVLAARTLGTSNMNLIRRHLIPNVIGQVIIMITFSIPGAIFLEAFLAFIGLGIPAPNASLGTILNDAKAFLRFQPSMVFIPASVLSLLMLSINIFANGLRDALDPRMRNN